MNDEPILFLLGSQSDVYNSNTSPNKFITTSLLLVITTSIVKYTIRTVLIHFLRLRSCLCEEVCSWQGCSECSGEI